MKTVDVQTRIDIKNVLVATDFSAAGRSALPYAGDIAQRYGANLYALHVRPSTVNPMTQRADWSALIEAAEKETKAQERMLRESIPWMEMEVVIREGDLWSELTSVIEENNIDLLVVGTRGRTGIRKFFLGSVAEEIFRKAPCPVLTVGPSCASEFRRGQISEILCAVSFNSESKKDVEYALSLAQEFQARLTMLHVITQPNFGEIVTPEQLKTACQHLLRDLVPSASEEWCKTRFLVEQGPIAEKILDVADRSETDLIVLGVRKPAGLPGAATHLPIATAHKVVSHANCPVLTVRS